jgi:hypothetical protein
LGWKIQSLAVSAFCKQNAAMSAMMQELKIKFCEAAILASARLAPNSTGYVAVVPIVIALLYVLAQLAWSIVAHQPSAIARWVEHTSNKNDTQEHLPC